MATQESGATPRIEDPDSGRLAALGYKQELSRVLSRFANFSVAFT